MRVITGLARGRKLKTPENYDIRPASEAVKESMFSAIQFEISGAKVLDLFAGTGQLGIEALSRGASKAVFVDIDTKAIALVRENVKSVGFEDKAEIVSMPYTGFLKTNRQTFDIALIDPPYGRKMIAKLFPALAEMMGENGIIICKHEKELVLPDEADGFYVKKRYEFGVTAVTLYRKKGEAGE